MSATFLDVIGERISPELASTNAMSETELLGILASWLDAQAPDELFAASPADRFKNWLQSTAFPHFRRLGEHGQKAWNYICDPDSALSKDRIGCIILGLSVLSGMQNVDISVVVAIVTLAIRYKSRKS